MPPVRFDKFYKYDELTAILKAWAGEHPDRFKLVSIGKSFEGRDIWLATVTNFATGPDTRQARFLHRGQYPRRRSHRLHGGAASDQQTAHAIWRRREGNARAWTRAPSTSFPA